MRVENNVLIDVNKEDILNGVFVLPENIKEIKELALFGCHNLKKVIIPNGMTKINASAFRGCYYLEEVVMPDTIESIGRCAFANCTSLKKVVLPNNIIEIEDSAFRNCIELTEVKMSKNIKKIGNKVFYDCRALDKIELPKSLSEIGTEAFYDCQKIKSLVLPDSISELKSKTFESCNKLEEIILPKNLKKIGDGCFNNCDSLEKIDLPKTLTEIGESAFERCYSLEKITIPKGVKVLNKSVFENCDSLVDVKLPDSLKVIKDNAFYYCTSLTNITLPKDLIEIDAGAFHTCQKLEEIKLPQNVKNVLNYTFAKCDLLNKLSFSKDIKNISDNAFSEAKFSHFYKTKNDIVLSKEPLKLDNVELQLTCFTNINSSFCQYIDNLTLFESISKKLEKYNAKLPFEFVKLLIENNQSFELNFKNLKRLQAFIPKDISNVIILDFYTFAYNIGCFSMDDNINQSANTWLENRLNAGEIKIENMHRDFDSWKPQGENKEFSEFLFSKNPQKKMTNFDEILIQDNYGHFLRRVYEEYKNPRADVDNGRYRDKSGRLLFQVFHNSKNEQGDDNSKPKGVKPTVELFKDYFIKKPFYGIETECDILIADELSKWQGMEQKHFDDAKKIMEEFVKNNIPLNLVGSHLEDISVKLEQYKKQTLELAEVGVKEVQEIVGKLAKQVSKNFTYDWLEKNDPINFCLGLYCNCCANLAGVGYGIMRSNFVHPDVQNLVVKNKNGIPIAKSTLYVNRKQQYGVFNNIEVFSNISEEEKEDVFKAYMEGINAFAKEYNKKNPNKPLRKLSVGIHLNDLSEQIRKGNRPSVILQGLDFCDYGKKGQRYEGDWSKDKQYLIWEENEEII